jgi:hypothetical protein
MDMPVSDHEVELLQNQGLEVEPRLVASEIHVHFEGG